ncbi:DUF3375 domain-containing protein [Geoalkalibacter halelectricus]|uniref:DUF3375 domain-containing protein n=1 Tax=Geoalkalibacter halelectricus TaxID=2847045 RepID=A0ABY5ZQN8_9BACT|nr:DUF3375 domain-containing protein [Geoalkalibacter halelectricus]MDO3377704.1 DUF3375 domain-containing protein [Geoalkalibacter halelectricus]UWZ81492.1 DUF3375 domain-containing protein [Geoalkalibacter halelectricus]
MDYEYIKSLKVNNPALRIISSDSAPLLLSFFHQVFIEPNRRSIPHEEILSLLEDELFRLREIYGEDSHKMSAKQYLVLWCDNNSYLSKRYPERGDEPVYDLTPSVAKAMEWIADLKPKAFVGTESRLLTVFNLLREIRSKASDSPERRIQELERTRDEIDREIDLINKGGYQPFSETQIRERFIEAEETARRLVADFRQVEQNVRDLDREARHLFVTTDAPKGDVLEGVFERRENITASDQGRSFRAFWEFLMTPARQQELTELLEGILVLEALEDLAKNAFLPDAKYALLDAGRSVYQTTNRLADQLRRYIDDRVHLENKRIMEIIRDIEQKSLELKNNPPADFNFSIDDIKPELDLTMARTLHKANPPEDFSGVMIEEGVVEIDVSALFSREDIDYGLLSDRVNQLLRDYDQITLPEVINRYPVTKGVGEIIAYFEVGHDSERVAVNDETRDIISIFVDGRERKLRVPRLIFTR